MTTQGGADFVPPAERIATFDNDGTLWTEQPVYFQLAFAFDQVKAMAARHSEWKTKRPFKALLEKDIKAFAATGDEAILEVVAATHAGMTTEDFSKSVLEWGYDARLDGREHEGGLEQGVPAPIAQNRQAIGLRSNRSTFRRPPRLGGGANDVPGSRRRL